MAREPLSGGKARQRLTTRRLLGLDRSGPPPPETLADAPLHVWTLPNVIGFIRIGLIPVFLVLALSSGDGRVASASIVYAVIGGSDYLDGMAARITGQYSRLGALLDPLTDRLLVISGVIVTWHFELLPRWALAVLAARELVMLLLTRYGLGHGLELKVNMVGRWAVWPTMFSLFLAMVSVTWVAEALLYLGVAMTLWATALYASDARVALRDRAAGPSSSP
ncbi:MAG: CDP-alcohol phosphatidyltransferase family protein [Thermoleophilaceae bacterium]